MAGSLSGCPSVGANRPDRATKSQRNRFFYGGHNGGQDTVWESLSPLYKKRYITAPYSPQGHERRSLALLCRIGCGKSV